MRTRSDATLLRDHARLMDEAYRYQRHFYDLTRKYYLFGRDRIIRRLDPPPGGSVLEVGCGTGRNLAIAARKYPHASFYGIDISNEMLKTAQANVAGSGRFDNIAMAQADARDFDAYLLFGVKKFDRIFFSYSLSMIPEWEQAAARALDHLAEHGGLHIVDFGEMGGWPALGRRLARSFLGRYHVRPVADFASKISALAEDRQLGCKTFQIAGGYAVLAKIDGGTTEVGW
jgi:S-adenosylmethionine-diacylgycerolhomoserine-N-methlytransferase